MAELYLSGDSIECHQAKVIFKKICPGNIFNDEKLGDCIKYNCSRDGAATIDKEFDPKPYNENDKKERLLKEGSSINIGDCIRAESIYVLVQGYKRETPKKKKGKFSHTHNGQTIVVKSSHVFGEIVYPFEHIKHAIEKKQKVIIE